MNGMVKAQFQSLAAFFGQTRHIVTNVTDGEGEYADGGVEG